VTKSNLCSVDVINLTPYSQKCHQSVNSDLICLRSLSSFRSML